MLKKIKVYNKKILYLTCSYQILHYYYIFRIVLTHNWYFFIIEEQKTNKDVKILVLTSCSLIIQKINGGVLNAIEDSRFAKSIK